MWLTINALQLFDEVYATTTGGPLRATTVIVYYLWDRAFVQFDAGYAAAMAYALFVVILVITAVQFRLARRQVHLMTDTVDACAAASRAARGAPTGRRRVCDCRSAHGIWCSSR